MTILVCVAWLGLATVGQVASAAREPAAELLVLNKSDSTLSFLDSRTGATIAVVGTGIGPHEIAVDPDGKLAVVANYGAQQAGNSLTLVDLERRLPFETLSLGEYARPHGLWFTAPGKLLVTCEEKRLLLEVDVPGRKVARTFPTEQDVSHMVCATPDGRRAFVSNINSGSTSVIDLESGALLAKLKCGGGTEAIDVAPDGKEVWAGNREGSLSILDVAGLTKVVDLPCKDFPIRLKFTPDGKHVLVSNARSGDIAVFDARTRKEHKRIRMELTPAEGSDLRLFNQQFGASPVPVGILIEPGGARAFVANTNADIVTVLDLEKLEVSARFKAGREPDGLGWIAR